jgi:hypothetical protein
MIAIKLKDGQTGYDVVGEYIRRYWEHNTYESVIISIGTSHDGNKYDLCNEVACPYNGDDVEFLYDWWEGEEFIRIFGIKSIDEIDISGGLYE